MLTVPSQRNMKNVKYAFAVRVGAPQSESAPCSNVGQKCLNISCHYRSSLVVINLITNNPLNDIKLTLSIIITTTYITDVCYNSRCYNISRGRRGRDRVVVGLYFSYIVAISFIGGGNRRKPLTCRKSLTNFIT
jgi:hypothetical protein